MTLTFSVQQRLFHFFCQLHVISLCLQLYKEIEICPKDTKVILFDKVESCTVGYGTLLPGHTLLFFTKQPATFISDITDSCFVNNKRGVTQCECIWP